MPWTYSQTTGVLIDQEGNVADSHGYSGAGLGRNNRAMEQVANVGPIPRGSYRIGPAHHSAHTGPVSMNLSPVGGTNTFGRSAFLIHGDNLSHTASHGCVIIPRVVRERISSSTDRTLIVQ